MFHPPALDPLVVLFAIAVAVVVIYYLIRWIRHTLGHLGLSPGEIAVIIWATLVGSLINIPLVPFGEGFLGINVGGAVVPIVLSVYLIRRKGLPVNEVIVGIIAVSLVSYLVTDYRPGQGVVAEFPWWLLPPFTAFLVAAFAYWHERPNSAALAYVSGTLGTLLGADIFRLPQILTGPAPEAVGDQTPILSIGGAGVFDMVFLAGILAVTMEAGLLARTRDNLVKQWGHNPIDAEYEQWVRKKEREAEENRAKYRQLQKQRKEDPRTYAQRKLREQSGHRDPAHRPGMKPPTPAQSPTPQGSRTQPSRYGSRYQSCASRPSYRSRYQSRTTTRSSARYRSRYGSRYRSRKEGTRSTRPDREGEKWRPLPVEQEQPSKETGKKQDKQRSPVEGPRPPPRQPRPASGTKRIPASHRVRGVYSRDDP